MPITIVPNAFHHRSLDVSVPMLDVQEAASHSDPRITTRHDRAQESLDGHAYIVTGCTAGAAR